MSSINDEGDELDGVEECHIPSAATHLATDPYCFLCHRDLPGWPPVLKYGHDWEFDLVGRTSPRPAPLPQRFSCTVTLTQAQSRNSPPRFA